MAAASGNNKAIAGISIKNSLETIMKQLLIIVALALMACGAVTGPEMDANVQVDATRTVMFMVTGSMRECGYFSYTDGSGNGQIIENCMVPFYVTVEMAEGTQIQVTAGKHGTEGNLTVCAIENHAIIGTDTAYEGDQEAQWIEGQ